MLFLGLILRTIASSSKAARAFLLRFFTDDFSSNWLIEVSSKQFLKPSQVIDLDLSSIT